MLTLAASIDQINATLPVRDRWAREAFCRIVSTADDLNRHLRLPDDPKIVERTDPLSEDTVVCGEFLVFVWWAHWPRLTIESYENEYDLAERAETCYRTFDNTWVFVDGLLRDCRFVDSMEVPGYTVFETVCGSLFAIKNSA